MKSILILIFVCLQSFSVLLFACPSNLRSDSDKSYGNRGDRCEGTYSNLVSYGKPEIKLISATAFLDKKSQSFSASLYAEFCHNNNTAHIIVESLKSNYRIDKIRNENVKNISNKCVIAKWSSNIIRGTNLKMRNLGIVVRFNNPSPSSEENITPVIFYTSKSKRNKMLPGQYIFKFKTNHKVRWKYSILDASNTIVEEGRYRTALANRILKVKWNGTDNELGTYKLTIEANNGLVQRIVNFQHNY